LLVASFYLWLWFSIMKISFSEWLILVMRNQARKSYSAKTFHVKVQYKSCTLFLISFIWHHFIWHVETVEGAMEICWTKWWNERQVGEARIGKFIVTASAAEVVFAKLFCIGNWSLFWGFESHSCYSSPPLVEMCNLAYSMSHVTHKLMHHSV